MHHSLAALRQSLEQRGGHLVIRKGRAVEQVVRLAQDVGAAGVFFGRRYEPWAIEEESRVEAALKDLGIEAKRFGGSLLVEPEAVRTAQGTPFKVFTPFYRAAQKAMPALALKPSAGSLVGAEPQVSGIAVEDLGLLPSAPDWSGGLQDTWMPGEEGALAALDRFLSDSIAAYDVDRDRPGVPGTSQLSAHLHFGEISPRVCYVRARQSAEREPENAKGVEAFIRELFWREFCQYLLFHWPEMTSRPFREEFARFPWRRDADALMVWQRGQTGYPLVDAGMRELWYTGWMHNRVRMVAASFLVKHLLVPWQDGERWFWDTLVDADQASNAANWQWVAGCGADAAPYFRIFNPVTQSRKFDPGGDYLRKWLPELAALPDKYIHEPWTAPETLLDEAGVALGRDYPSPIVDHGAGRERALAAFKDFRSDDG